MKVLKEKGALETLSAKITKDTKEYSDTILSVLEDASASLDKHSRELSVIVDNIVKEIIKLQKQKETLLLDVEVLEDRKKQSDEREEQLRRQAETISQRDGELTSLTKKYKEKLENTNELERQLKKKNEVLGERLKNYKIAVPIKN